MSDVIFAILGLAAAGLLIVPAALVLRWLELHAERRAHETSAA